MENEPREDREVGETYVDEIVLQVDDRHAQEADEKNDVGQDDRPIEGKPCLH